MRRILLTFLFLLTSCSAPPPLPAGTPAPTFTPGISFTVLYHPDGPLYVGDQVSIEVLSPSNFKSDGQKVRALFGDPSTGSGQVLGETNFGSFGIGGRQQATFYWVWDTHGLNSGVHALTFSVLPAGPTWTENVSLLPAADVPASEPGARWESARSACCTISYISGTDAARDIETLKATADAQAADVEQRLGVKFKGKIPLTFLPRVLGQGGFTSNAIYVSYLDQNYAGSSVAQVVHHEMIHWLDAQMGGDARLTMLQEGLAVYFSDGHFKVEPIAPRAAALLQLNWYIPLRQLVNSFHTSQHEIGYMEAAALTAYMIKTYGWERYNAFYRDLQPMKHGSEADILNTALQAHFGLALEQLETDFTAFLRQQTVTQNNLTDVRLTVAFYDTVRRYEQELDPSAYFMTAWLPDGADMRQRGLVADYLRHPVSMLGRQIESLLVSGDASLRTGDYKTTELNIRVADMLLDVIANLQEK